MPVIKWPRSDSDGSYVKINVRGNKGFYSIHYRSNMMHLDDSEENYVQKTNNSIKLYLNLVP